MSMTKEYYSYHSTTSKKTPTASQQLEPKDHPYQPEKLSKLRTLNIPRYRKLLWMCPLRPDIQYATLELTRAVQKPDQHDKQNAKHLLRYLQGTRNYKLHLRPKQPTTNEPYIKAFCDSDWAGCSTTRKSPTGTVRQFAGVTHLHRVCHRQFIHKMSSWDSPKEQNTLT
eukprot:198346-Amphidinium_carterae.5